MKLTNLVLPAIIGLVATTANANTISQAPTTTQIPYEAPSKPKEETQDYTTQEAILEKDDREYLFRPTLDKRRRK